MPRCCCALEARAWLADLTDFAPTAAMLHDGLCVGKARASGKAAVLHGVRCMLWIAPRTCGTFACCVCLKGSPRNPHDAPVVSAPTRRPLHQTQPSSAEGMLRRELPAPLVCPTVWLALRAPGAAVLTGYGVLMWYSRSTVVAPPFGWACTPSGSSACLPRPRAAAPRRQRALRASRTRGILAARRTSLRHRVPAEAVRRSDVSHPTTNTLQHAATDDNTLQHVPACCNPRQRSMRLRTLRRRAPAEAVRRSSARRVSDSARRLCAALVPRAWRTRRSGGWLRRLIRQ
jgi:hypothetical protein